VVDHAWIQVNPSKDGKTWIQVEVGEVAMTLAKESQSTTYGVLGLITIKPINSHYKMVLGYQLIDNQVVITDVTSTFG
jgi:hypothetical protein